MKITSENATAVSIGKFQPFGVIREILPIICVPIPVICEILKICVPIRVICEILIIRV
jgi:hypothetical protein